MSLAKRLWTDIDTSNKNLVEGLRNVATLYKENIGAYEAAVETLSLLEPSRWATVGGSDVTRPVIQAFDKVFRASEASYL